MAALTGSVALYYGYASIPEGKSIASYGEVSEEELKHASESIKNAPDRFDQTIKIMNTLYHKLHNQPVAKDINIERLNSQQNIKLLYPGYGIISFYPNKTIYFPKNMMTPGYLAHEMGHMHYQGMEDFLNDNFVKSKQYFLLSLEAATVDEGPSIFSQIEFAAVASNYDQLLAKQIYQSIENTGYGLSGYRIPKLTIENLILKYGDAKTVKAKLLELSCYKNYKKFLGQNKVEPTLATYFDQYFTFYSSYLAPGQNDLSIFKNFVLKEIVEGSFELQSNWSEEFFDSLPKPFLKKILEKSFRHHQDPAFSVYEKFILQKKGTAKQLEFYKKSYPDWLTWEGVTKPFFNRTKASKMEFIIHNNLQGLFESYLSQRLNNYLKTKTKK